MQNNFGEWLSWKRNPPAARNMGGVWERQIRTARMILEFIQMTHGASLSDESLQTQLVEVEALVNSCPLTTDLLSDTNSFIPLSPINLLTMKWKVVMSLTIKSIFKWILGLMEKGSADDKSELMKMKFTKV